MGDVDASGCLLFRRDPYMNAIQQSNVDVHFTGVKKLTQDGVVGDGGIERKVDTVICATGTSHL